MTTRVPIELEELLSPAWLTAALRPSYPGLEITGVEHGPVVSRVSTNARFRIDCAGGVPDGLSSHLCAKGYFGEQARAPRPMGESEACFYRDLAAATGVRTLRSVYADVDAETGHGLVITEDVVVQGARFLDAGSEYTPDQVAESLEQFATLHAATWSDPGCATTPWLESRLALVAQGRGIDVIQRNFEGPIGRGVPEVVRHAEQLYDVYLMVVAEAARATPWSVVHGDAHVGNVYLDRAGRPGLLDWQLVHRGPWYLDVGYHLASTLPVEDRRRHEDDLVHHYLDRLAAAGVDPPTWDDAWTGIRRGIIHGFYLWAITFMVDPAITAALLERLGTAAADHDVFGAIGGTTARP